MITANCPSPVVRSVGPLPRSPFSGANVTTTTVAVASLPLPLKELPLKEAAKAKPKAEELSLVAQVRMAFQKEHRLAMLCGSLMGGVVPLCAFEIAHFETRTNPYLWILVAGALLFSATTLWQFGKLAFKHRVKALGFAVILEGVLIFSTTPWLTWLALGYLIAINAVATGTNLALDHRA